MQATILAVNLQMYIQEVLEVRIPTIWKMQSQIGDQPNECMSGYEALTKNAKQSNGEVTGCRSMLIARWQMLFRVLIVLQASIWFFEQQFLVFGELLAQVPQSSKLGAW